MFPRRLLSVVALVVLVVSATTFVSAQESAEETLRDAREAREESRRAQADLAKDIDLLEASDAELIAALEALNEQIFAQEQLVATAQDEVARARAEEARLREEIAATRLAAVELQERAFDRMVAAYVAPRDESITSSDPTASARREALFRQVDLDSQDLIDELRAVEDDLNVLEQRADQAALDAAEREVELQAALAVLEDDVAAQERLRAELADEIAALEQQFEDMARAEAELVAVIRDAQREIARQEALARAATSTTTTTTTTSTTAPPTTAADPSTDDGDTTDTTVADDADAGDGDGDDTDSDDGTDTGTTTTTEAHADVTPSTTQNAAIESDGRCQPATTTATPIAIGNSAATKATTDRHRGAVTHTTPTATVAATVA